MAIDAKDLEVAANDTWERIRDARKLGVQFGEETITNLILLDLKRAGPRRMEFLQTPKSKEPWSGTDFEWWIGRPGQWLRLAIQAKRVNSSIPSLRYDALGHKVGGIRQFDLLLRYATANKAMPAYCLYNYSPSGITTDHWHCCTKPAEPKQLGISIVNPSIIRAALGKTGERCFGKVHSQTGALPWRCLAKCPHGPWNSSTNNIANRKEQGINQIFQESPEFFDELPPSVEAGRESGLLSTFSPNFYRTAIGVPKRVLVYDFSRVVDE